MSWPASSALDPIQLRLKNAAKQGTKAAHGPVFPVIGYEETLRQALDPADHYKSPLGKNQGRGVTSGYWFNAGGKSSAQVNITEDGNVLVMTGHPDIGGSRASTANIRGRAAGRPPQPHQRDDRRYRERRLLEPDRRQQGHLRVGHGGHAVGRNGHQASCARRAAKIWKIDDDAVTWDNGYARPAGENAGKFEPLSLAQIQPPRQRRPAARSAPARSSTRSAPRAASPPTSPTSRSISATGCTRVIRMTCFQDVGRAIHPDYVEGQLQGAMAQAIGWALTKEYIYNKRGQLDNAGFLDYRMPVASDLPMIECGLVEVPNPKHPQGVKGVGEVPLVPAMAAVANAVHNAIGIRFDDLPMSPPRVPEALDEQLQRAAE